MFQKHHFLFLMALGLFLVLTIPVAILPAIHNQSENEPLPNSKPFTAQQLAGKKVYIDNGCVACHTQQVRNVAMDREWGQRPGIPADYAHIKRTDFWRNTATLMGTERTGPDLTTIGERQPSTTWHLLHLYQPRKLVEASIMPAYPWLFEEKEKAASDDVILLIPGRPQGKKNRVVVAKKEALDLVAYLQSLRQVALYEQEAPSFLYETLDTTTKGVDAPDSVSSSLPDGQVLYLKYCAACHQPNGNGLKGAFPPLKGSTIVNGQNLNLLVEIIMYGYDARPEYAVMNAVGQDNKLTANQIAAIINYEKTAWGNTSDPVTLKQVEQIINTLNQQP